MSSVFAYNSKDLDSIQVVDSGKRTAADAPSGWVEIAEAKIRYDDR